MDLGGQWMGTNHTRLQALVKELGIKVRRLAVFKRWAQLGWRQG